MKLFLKSLIFFLALSALSASCSKEGPIGGVVAGSPSLVWKRTVLAQDTISTSTSADTVTQALGSYLSPIYYEVQISADSISGGTTATATLQQSIDDGTTWYDLGNATINGVSTRTRLSGSVQGGTLRLNTLAASSTQVTTINTSYIIAGKTQ